MKRKTDCTERFSFPYESPDMLFVEVANEGVLCESLEHNQEMELPDYNPSSGSW